MIYKLKAPLKSYVWGGTKLISDWGKTTDLPLVAESWELSFHPDGTCLVDGGVHDGKPITEVVSRADWGDNCQNFSFFPVLNKLIDAKQNLSVQVHPTDDYALEHEGQYGKTEMWHVLDADEGACLYIGLNRDLTPEEFAKCVSDGSICNYLNAVQVHPGETYFIPSGTLHAIGAGITLFEVQQNSSLTYRVFDYNRVGLDGKPRQLHVEKAKKVTNLNKYVVPDAHRDGLLGRCKYFSAYRFCGERSFTYDHSFCSITVVSGNIKLNGVELCKGETAFVTAGQPCCVTGSGQYVLTCVE